jgi:hypothetical protein
LYSILFVLLVIEIQHHQELKKAEIETKQALLFGCFCLKQNKRSYSAVFGGSKP